LGAELLRFDIPPVWSGVVRVQAFITFVVCSVAVFVTPWVLIYLSVAGAVRGFVSPQRDPSSAMIGKFLKSRGWLGRQENAGAKMFAAKLLFIGSAAALLMAVFNMAGWQYVCYALMLFSFLEWAFAFCAGCWVYVLWWRLFSPQK
jgi:Domain of unknown function (DUF4395)